MQHAYWRESLPVWGQKERRTGHMAVLVRSRAMRQGVSAGRTVAPVLPLWGLGASPEAPGWDAAEGVGLLAGMEADPGFGEVADVRGARRHCCRGGER